MPTYDYLCPENGRTIQVNHRMNDSISTWAELCELSGQSLSSTPADSPVKKLLSAPSVVTPTIGEWKRNPAKEKKSTKKPGHGPGCGCC